ncbi:MAG TPA: D-2-hydroxyacid dehydrogenase [Hyphomonadaceae bacterium]|jgi:phosphoglycerate dehydrogenase-like enzyme|nr:D-2-hydroxyacid dehydrogenase [Hyphomonadaceae bacterium]
MTKRVLIIEKEHPADLAVYADVIGKAQPRVEVLMAATEDEALSRCGGVTAIIAKAHSISAEVVAATPRLDWVQALTTGTDHLASVDLPPGVVITSARGIHGPQMSELAFMFMLAFLRDIRTVLGDQEKAIWSRRPQRLLYGKTVVIVGVGAISEALAQRCKAFGMITIGVSSMPRSAAGFDEVVGRESLLEVAGRADFLIVVAPYSPATHQMIDRSVLAAMAPHAVLINIARGKVCDEAALVEALREKRIAGAGLDVFAVEPLPPDHSLWGLDNVILTPHIGGMSDSYVRQTLPLVLENLGFYCAGERHRMRNIVDRQGNG